MKIDGEPVDPNELSAEFRRLMESQKERPQELRLPDEDVRRIAVRNVIDKRLIEREAQRRFPKVSAEEVRRRGSQLQKQYGEAFDPDAHRHQIEDDVRVGRLVREAHAGAPRVTEDEARTEYDRDPDRFAEPVRVHCSHIVRHTFGGADPGKALQQIMEAQRMLRSGSPFEAVARQFSDQHGRAGDLGTFARGAMVERFENVVFRMKSGDVSDVFQTEFGYHIALVHERIPARARPYEEARADVMKALREQRRSKAFEQLVVELRAAANIDESDTDGTNLVTTDTPTITGDPE